MSDEAPSGYVSESPEGAPGLAEGVDAVREAAAEAAAEEARKKAAQIKKEEGAARRHDSKFAETFVKFLQTESDDEFLEILVNLLDRNVPSSFLLATISLLDDEAATVFTSEITVPADRVQALVKAIDNQLNLTQADSDHTVKLRSWIMRIIAAVDMLDAETRPRLTAKNREADTWIKDLLQACLLRIVLQTTTQNRLDASQLATGILSLIHHRPILGHII